jgi:mannonate dehydratase
MSAGALAGCQLSLREGMLNPCRTGLPDHLAHDPLVTAAWNGIHARDFWDAHCHLYGSGDSGGGPWASNAIANPSLPQDFLKRRFFLNAGCANEAPGRIDASLVDRLVEQLDAFPAGAKVMLLAFDWVRDDRGAPDMEASTFQVPDAYAAEVAARHPARFEWIASIHPLAPDALDRIDEAVVRGARAVKWLPQVHRIDPASPRCDDFYRKLVALRLPLLTHAGAEQAVRSSAEPLGNPLRLRRPLEHGVRVIVAHCASLGDGRDLDRGEAGPVVANFDLFARLLDTPSYRTLLLGDISALTLANRMDVLPRVLERQDWHSRLVDGSDYPLPGIPPLVSLDGLVERGMLDPEAVAPLRAIRGHNALLFDFVLKRSLAYRGMRFDPRVFATRRHFTRSTEAPT